MECPEPQRRTQKNVADFRRCLLRTMNELRQANNVAPLRSITGYKKLFGTESTEQTYELLEDLNKVKKIDAEHFSEYSDISPIIYGDEIEGEDTLDNSGLNELKKLISKKFLGKNIFISYLDNNRNIIRDKFYRVPINKSDFIKKWDASWSWNWRDSESTIFDIEIESGHFITRGGFIYIYEELQIDPKIIQQSYLENETLNCVFQPIKDICDKKILESKASSINYKTLLNKIVKLEKIYEKGVPDDKMEEVMTKLNVKMKIHYPFESTKIKTFNGTTTKSLLSLNYINTRINHLEYYDNDEKNIVMLESEEFIDKHKELWNLIDDDDPINFIYKKNTDGIITEIKTPTNTYRIKGKTNIFKEFEKFYGLNNCYLCDVKDELLSKFIREGCKITSSVINNLYTDIKKYKNDFIEIDQIKSYTQFKQCKYYEGFVGKITDFRKTDKIQGIGFYLIGNIDWTNANTKIKEIQRAFKIWYGRNVYSSVELKLLSNYGVKYNIIGGCWGNRIDFEFCDDMLLKGADGVPNYSRWTGAKTMTNFYDEYYMKTRDLEYVSHIKEKCENVSYYDGTMVFSIKKEFNYHLSHISGFIYSYQRINLIDQLFNMDINKVLRINTDGIKYLDHEYKLNGTFKLEETPSINGFISDPREEGFITNTNNSNKYDLLKYKIHFKNTHDRIHYDNELFIGAGGCGKTHYNLIDTGLVRPCYVVNSYKLLTSKQKEYKCNVEILANVEGLGTYDKQQSILKKYNTFLIDEASMITEEQKLKVFSYYQSCKLIFCGDIGFQAQPIGGDEINLKSFQHITEFKENYRTNDNNLLKILNDMRKCITNDTCYNCDNLKHIGIENVKKIYNINDIVLTYTKNKRKGYDDLIGEKYLITKSTDNYNRGDIIYSLPKHKNYEKTNAFTTHSVQGETFKDKIFIDIEILNSGNLRLLYTAISRAKKLEQIYIVNDVKSN